jgi:hypothetical protein
VGPAAPSTTVTGEVGVVGRGVHQAVEHRHGFVAAELEDDVVEDHLPIEQRGGGVVVRVALLPTERIASTVSRRSV